MGQEELCVVKVINTSKKTSGSLRDVRPEWALFSCAPQPHPFSVRQESRAIGVLWEGFCREGKVSDAGERRRLTLAWSKDSAWS